ncbi:MAG: preprotein translocase subunit SecE [Cytophagales bacterium]|nr:preprotein translocase subunit SecE [Cytophagales bacterium]
MNKIFSFLSNSFDDLIHKISWQKFNDLFDDTWYVILICIFMTLIVGGFDILLKMSFSALYKII